MIGRTQKIFTFICMLSTACLLGCYKGLRNVVRTEATFSPSDLKLIETYCRVTFPTETHGINLFVDNESCVDPSLVAKLSLSANDFALLRDQMARFPADNVELINGLSGQVSWWYSASRIPVVIYHYTTPQMTFVHCAAFADNGTNFVVFVECVQI